MAGASACQSAPVMARPCCGVCCGLSTAATGFHESSRERQARVRAAIEAMSPVDREIFLRYYYYLQPAPEIAQAMGLTHGAVRTRLSRGRAALKKILLQEDAVWT